jgi:hypothetical protein
VVSGGSKRGQYVGSIEIECDVIGGMFFANLALIPVALLGVRLRAVKDGALRADQPHEQQDASL